MWFPWSNTNAVSYTHLDVYKRQDYGRPAALQTASPLEKIYEEIARNVVQETVIRNENLAPTEAIKITTMAGCSAVKK